MSESIIPMTLDHLEICIVLYMEVFNSEPWNESWTEQITRERLTDLMHTPNFLGFIVIENKLPLGFIAGNSKHTYTGLTFYIAEICISHKMQGKGYGSKLLQFLENELKQWDVRSLYLLTSISGLAEAFYTKNGYVVNKNRIVMKKSL
ncbi:N-acetyltransferase [Bacillus sp. 03113]|uniref:GNAT family N-acetyltransferase n=1 Tax=Bacillus sp. 03113 TaxID=2578211 RepID=UPI0011433D86|nr:GNAT family N-acetyltransferase [Bacillus sp. 03113]